MGAVGAVAATVSVTTISGELVASVPDTRTRARYVPAASGPLAVASVSVAGAVVLPSVALSHPVGWPAE